MRCNGTYGRTHLSAEPRAQDSLREGAAKSGGLASPASADKDRGARRPGTASLPDPKPAAAPWPYSSLSRAEPGARGGAGPSLGPSEAPPLTAPPPPRAGPAAGARPGRAARGPRGRRAPCGPGERPEGAGGASRSRRGVGRRERRGRRTLHSRRGPALAPPPRSLPPPRVRRNAKTGPGTQSPRPPAPEPRPEPLPRQTPQPNSRPLGASERGPVDTPALGLGGQVCGGRGSRDATQVDRGLDPERVGAR